MGIVFYVTDIDDNEWMALDFLLEDVENGNRSEENLFNDETFLR